MTILPYKAIQAYTELLDIVRSFPFEDIEDVLTSEFMDVKANIIRKNDEEHYIDVNYKSIAVTIVRDENFMATISPTSVEYYEEDT